MQRNVTHPGLQATAEAELQSGVTAVGTTLDDPEHQSLVHQLRQAVGANESLLKYFLDPRTQIERGHADVLLRLGRWRYIRRQGTVLIVRTAQCGHADA